MIHLSSEEDTKRFAELLAEYLPRAGVVVGLSGDLGAGKTTLVRYFSQALSIPTPVSSPTYVLQHEYSNESSKVEHWDLYRLRGGSEELYEPVGEGEYRFIEWIERLGDEEIPLDLILRLEVDHESGMRRVSVAGPLAEVILQAWE